MKKLSFLLLLAFSSISLTAQPISPDGGLKSGVSYVMDEYGNLVETKMPIVSFETDRYDFGEVREGMNASHDFVFTNIGHSPLIITDVKTSCDCTATYWTKEPIMPGEKSIITANFDTNGRPGAFVKSLTIFSNAIEQQMQLFIKGKVVQTLNIEPVEQLPDSPIYIPMPDFE